MSTTMMLLIAWAGLTGLLIVLLIYRGTLTMHEDDQLFLDDAQAQMRDEQVLLMKRVNRLQTPIRALSGISGALILALCALWIYDMYQHF